MLGRVFGSFVLALALGIGTASAETLTLSGEVTYLERIALPEHGSLRISLIDLAAPETPRVLAQGAIATPGQVPLSFTLNFEDSVLAAGMSYGLVAEIVAEGAIWFRNNLPEPVDLAAPDAIEIVVNFAGKIIDPNAAPVVTISPDLLDVTWRAVDIGGVAALPNVESSLSIAADMRAGGRAGCNNYFAQARIDGEMLAFSAVAATRMSCSGPGGEQETKFFEALAATRFWRLSGDTLTLVDANGRDLARLIRTAL